MTGLLGIIRRPQSWLIFVLLALITLPHYHEAIGQPQFITGILVDFGLQRHAFERILYLAPIVWAGSLFRWQGAFITSVIVLGCMLPRALIFSPTPLDATMESGAVFILGNVLAVAFESLRRERRRRTQLEQTRHELEASEQNYRSLFENAHDAIWVQDLKGNITAANEATTRLTGYDMETLTHMNVREFLSDDCLELARIIKRDLLHGNRNEGPYDQCIMRKDRTQAFLTLSSSLISGDSGPTAIQHIARDVTEERQMQENMRFYLQQVTRAQEEERKRISMELHDETIQELVVLSRQLDELASSDKIQSEENRHRLEELRQETNSIMRGVRRLSQDLRPAALDRLGLSAALEWLATDISDYSGIATEVNVIGSERRLTEEIEMVLFRITQESLRNVWRHAEATKVKITVTFEEDKVIIAVNDNGKGFSPPQRMGDMAKDGKLGLAGMEERARLVGGTLVIQSHPGYGSMVTLELPV
ncbi:MAG TPA: PAS domain S-box protein [Dehalococcoidia bacterium]|nr:PAS domain S-box protein [Dehalococcoidia bacterium]